MHVLIDARMVSKQNFGISRYVYGLISALIQIDKKNRYSLLVKDDFLAPLIKEHDNFSLVRARAKWLSLAEQFELPWLIKKLKPDLFNCTISVPFILPCPTLVTIHDLIHLKYPEHYSLRHKIYYRIFFRSIIKKLKGIITVSEASRKDIAYYYAVPETEIDIARPAVGAEFHKIMDKTEVDRFKKERGLPEKFMLYVGNRKKHKNVAGLVKAYALLPDRIKEQYALVLSGASDPALEDLARGQKVADRIRYLGNILDEELPLAYNAAELFVFPTLYEGFGMPPLEAMACGVPVVTSNVASIPEVVGDAAVLVDPKNTRELAEAMARVLENGDLKAQLRSRALEQARRFTWEECAQNTLRTYQEALT
ncbi:MAG: glycosyltransferase family 4 protein [Candidatus Saganbacteria bacterium]|nr:glycosyltransferase family 4 protein [Candidatus Saganbacteria bacterium]